MPDGASRFTRLPASSRVLDICYGRRSVRRFTDEPVCAADLDAVLVATERFCAQEGFRAVSLIVVRDPTARARVLAGAMQGLVGKINPWLRNLKAPLLVVLCATYEEAPVVDDRRLAVAEAAQALEVFVLAAAARGLGTCWMAGISEDGLRRALGVPTGTGIVAMTPLGHVPAARALLSWDNAAYHLLSRRRKAMSDIVFAGRLP